MSLKGRQLPTADVGHPDAQPGGQLSGGEITHPAVAGRPSVAASDATPMPAVQLQEPLTSAGFPAAQLHLASRPQRNGEVAS